MGPVTNVKVKLLFFVSLLGILLIISTPVVNSVFVNLISPTETVPLSSSATVFVDPDKIIKDYVLDPGYQIGDKFTVHVNISGVTDLFTWQLNMSWDSSILNVSSSTGGEFLARSDNQTSSEVLGVVINATDNVEGYSGMAESILANVTGITGSGRLVSIEFLVVGYGCTNLTINVGGTLPTMLFDSAGSSINFTPVNGFFKNKIHGDAYGDGMITPADIGKLFDHWTDPPGLYPYSRCVDTYDDGQITPADIGVIFDNWDRSVTLP